MKYFTFELWRGMQTGASADDAPERYAQFVASIYDRLPPDVLRLEQDVSLHDGRIQLLRLDVVGQTLDIYIDGYRDLNAPCALHLHYRGVSIFETTNVADESLSGPSGYGDLGYWEVDIDPGGFEHRFLFSTGIEMRIVFRSLSLRISDRDAEV
jgi:hypothetical protein